MTHYPKFALIYRFFCLIFGLGISLLLGYGFFCYVEIKNKTGIYIFGLLILIIAMLILITYINIMCAEKVFHRTDSDLINELLIEECLKCCCTIKYKIPQRIKLNSVKIRDMIAMDLRK